MASVFTDEGKREVIQKIIEHRTNLGVSQNKLSKIAGMPQATISRIESGLQVPRLETIIKIAQAINYPLEVK